MAVLTSWTPEPVLCPTFKFVFFNFCHMICLWVASKSSDCSRLLICRVRSVTGATHHFAPVAQLVAALVLRTKSCEFESHLGYHFLPHRSVVGRLTLAQETEVRLLLRQPYYRYLMQHYFCIIYDIIHMIKENENG